MLRKIFLSTIFSVLAVQAVVLDFEELVKNNNNNIDATFEQYVTKSTKPVVVEFFMVGCGPCNQMAPIFKQVSDEMPDVTFIKIEIRRFGTLADRLSIRSAPTFLYYKRGQELANKRHHPVDAATLRRNIKTNFSI